MKIDSHVHCDKTSPDSIREILNKCEKNETALCIMGLTPKCDHQPPAPANETILKIANQYPELLIPFAWVDLWDKVNNNIAELAEMGFRGLKFLCPYYAYDHDLYMPVYQAAERLKLPVIFHTGLFRASKFDPVHQRPLLQNMAPFTLDRIARSFPNLKMIMAHMGTALWRHEGATLIQLHPNLYADLAGCGNFGIRSEKLSDFMYGDRDKTSNWPTGMEKLVLGSDAYFTHPDTLDNAQEHYNRLLNELHVPKDIQDNIMGKTVAGWLAEQ